jgi:hypothetical protein
MWRRKGEGIGERIVCEREAVGGGGRDMNEIEDDER